MLRPRRCIGDGRGTPAMPIGPFVTGIQFTIMTFTRTQKKAVVMAEHVASEPEDQLPDRPRHKRRSRAGDPEGSPRKVCRTSC